MTRLTKLVKRTTEAGTMPHGFKKNLILTLYPATETHGAILGIRESRRHDEITFDVGDLYARAVVRRAMSEKRKRTGK